MIDDVRHDETAQWEGILGMVHMGEDFAADYWAVTLARSTVVVALKAIGTLVLR